MGFTLPSFWRATTPPTTAQLNEQRALDATATLELEGAQAPQSKTITSGSISPTASYIIVDTEGSAAADDLDIINPVLSASENLHDGMVVYLKAADSGRVVTVKNSSSVNGINTYDGNDYALSTTHWLKLQLRSGKWYEVEGRAMETALAAATAAAAAATAADHATTKSGTSSTASGTAAKVVTCSGFELSDQARIFVTFSNANTVADAITLNVNGTGAKSVYNQTGIISASNTALFAANQPIEFRYDGTGWVFFDAVKANATALSTKLNTGMENADLSKCNVILQQVSYETGEVATGTTAIPPDNTIPQITEGDQYMSLAITPKSSTSRLEIRVIFGCSVADGTRPIVALHRDSGPNAIAAMISSLGGGGASVAMPFTHSEPSNSTSPTTFKVRAGSASGSTLTFNGTAGTRYLGGVYRSSIIITEFAV